MQKRSPLPADHGGPGRIARSAGLQVFVTVLAMIAVMATTLLVADHARERAVRAREAQATAERLRATSQAVGALKATAQIDVSQRPSQAPQIAIGTGLRGRTLLSEMVDQSVRLHRLAPGAATAALRDDIQGFRDLMYRSLDRFSFTDGRRWLRVLTTVEPTLARVDARVTTVTASQRAAAQRADGRARLLLVLSLVGGSTALLGLAFVITMMRRHSQRAAIARAVEREGDARVHALVEHAADVICVLNGWGTVKWIAPSIHGMVGTGADHFAGKAVLDLLHPDDVAQATAQFVDALDRGSAARIVARIRHTDGHWIHVEAVAADRRRDPSIGGVLLTMRDVSERVTLQHRLEHLALHDPLTGLPNRRLLERQLAGTLATSPVTVAYVDLDDFKTINDTLGHHAGDSVLSAVGERIRRVLDAGDVVARQGGDEFAIMLDGVHDEATASHRVGQIMAALAPPLQITGHRLSLSASAGVAVSPMGTPAEDALRNADIAMYAAKRRGDRRIQLYHPQMHQAIVDRMELGGRLPQAIVDGELVLDLQPLVDLGDDRIAGVEALVRWEHPERGRLSPAEFVSLAEEIGTVGALGLWVLRTACQQLRALQAATPDPLFVSVNVSVSQLADGHFPQAVADTIATTGVDPSAVVLELTESLFVEDHHHVLDQLRQLKAIGVRLALDDFGTGYAVLGHLQEFPLDIVKIDRSFAAGLTESPERATLFAGIVGLAHGLGMTVVAEGIEEPVQLEHVRRAGVTYAQGYLLSRPVPAPEVVELLAGADADPRLMATHELSVAGGGQAARCRS